MFGSFLLVTQFLDIHKDLSQVRRTIVHKKKSSLLSCAVFFKIL